MAEFLPAVEYVLTNEAADLLIDRATGEYSRFGITAKFAIAAGLCTDAGAMEYINGMTRELAIQIYGRFFWNRLLLSGFKDQLIANKVLDMAVNMGESSAVKFLQKAVNNLSGTLKPDGKLGPCTLAAVNARDPWEVLIELKAEATASYKRIVDSDPRKYGKYLAGWQARAERG